MLAIPDTKILCRINFVLPGQGHFGQMCQHLAIAATCCRHVGNFPSQVPSHGGQSDGGSNFEGIVDVCIKRVVHSTVYVACCVVVVLLALERCRDTQHFLAHVGDNGAIVGDLAQTRPSVDVGLGECDPFECAGKMIAEGAKIEKIGMVAHAWRIGNEGFDCVIIDGGFHVDVNLRGTVPLC